MRLEARSRSSPARRRGSAKASRGNSWPGRQGRRRRSATRRRRRAGPHRRSTARAWCARRRHRGGRRRGDGPSRRRSLRRPRHPRQQRRHGAPAAARRGARRGLLRPHPRRQRERRSTYREGGRAALQGAKARRDPQHRQNSAGREPRAAAHRYNASKGWVIPATRSMAGRAGAVRHPRLRVEPGGRRDADAGRPSWARTRPRSRAKFPRHDPAGTLLDAGRPRQRRGGLSVRATKPR